MGITVTDQFCGAGGSSLGARLAGAEIKMAINHWKLAVETHNTNFPETAHDCVDISACDPRRYPNTDILITSPECTNHSLSKGVQRRNIAQMDLWGNNKIDPGEERSRMTMWDVVRFAEHHRYKLIIVENVVDAAKWHLFDAWLFAMKALDYEWEIVYFNSMFAWPTPQSRDRMYVVFWQHGNKKPDLDIRPVSRCVKCEADVFAVQAWKNQRWGRYGTRNQYVYRCPKCASEITPYYYAAANAIDWSLPGQRIGDRVRPLKPKTLDRIRYGLDKFGSVSMLTQLDHTKTEGKYSRPVTEPFPTQTTAEVQALFTPFIVKTDHSHSDGNHPRSVNEPMITQTGRQANAVVMPPPFLIEYYSRKDAASGIDEAMSTVTIERRHALISPFVVEFWGTSTVRSTEEPLSTVVSNPHHGLVMPFLTSYYGQNQASSALDAANTITTVDRHALVRPNPDIDDCYFRMLQPHEIGAAMAFPEDYKVVGNNREKVRQYGNAVTPPVMQMLIERGIATFQ